MRGIKDIAELTRLAGLAPSTINNNLNKAERLGREPEFDAKTARKIAGAGRVSFAWLSGEGADPDAGDVPPVPTPRPKEDALDTNSRRLDAAPGAEMDALAARVAALETAVAALQKRQ